MTSSRRNHLVVGLSGVTNGGKTTLCTKLAAHFSPSVEILLLDDYFHTDTSLLELVPELNHYDFDRLSSLDMERYVADVERTIERFASTPSPPSPLLLILDGFLLFNHPHLLSLCHLRYDFHLPYEEAKRRRAQRTYMPPDPPGYFDAIAWPAYLRHRAEIEALKSQEKIVSLDGTEEAERVFERVVTDVESAMREL